MRIETWDTGFIRARRRDVHAVLAEPSHYGQWWPGVRVRALGRPVQRLVEADAGDTGAGTAGVGAGWRMRFRPPGWRARSHRLDVELVKARPDLGLRFRVRGAAEGEIEFFYVDEPNGVLVHYLSRLEVSSARRARRLGRDHRAVAREALHALKDRLEGGRVPGTEPDPRLLADQQAAIAAYQAGVEAHARKTAPAQDGGGAGGAAPAP